jgi:hypothetical protein
MITSTSDKHPPSQIPDVICSLCGAHMRLIAIESSVEDEGKFTFQCRCGHEYEMVEWRPALPRDQSDTW